jgi:hypothetical protein
MPTVEALTNALVRGSAIPDPTPELAELSLNAYGVHVRSRAARLTQRRREVCARHRELFDVLRFANHIATVELRHRYPAAPDIIHPDANLDLRMRFLLDEIDERRFKETLQAREKARRKRDAVHQVLRTLADVAADLLADVVAADGAAHAVARVGEQMRALADYANGALAAVARRYGCVVPWVDRATWETPLATTTTAAEATAAGAAAGPAASSASV